MRPRIRQEQYRFHMPAFTPVTKWQRACRKLFGWCIGAYWANKNDRYYCCLLGLAMCDLDITPGMLARKRYLWDKCKWWGMVDDRPLHILE